MTETNNMHYTLRPREQKANYLELSGTESDSYQYSSSDCSKFRSTRQTTRRKQTLSIRRALDVEMVDSSLVETPRRGRGGHARKWGGHGGSSGELGQGHGEGSNRWGVRVTQNYCPSQNQATYGEQNKEASYLGQSYVMEKSPSTNNMPYTLRPREQKANYLDLSDTESDSYHSSSDCSKFRSTRGTISKKTTSSTSRALDIEMLDSRLDEIPILGHGQGHGHGGHGDDDTCFVCGDGGNLFCCYKCPSKYHPSCLNMERVPYDWFCPNCICKHCGVGGKKLIMCSQCKKKFHQRCFRKFEMDSSKEAVECSKLYCGLGCKEIYEKLQGSLGIKNGMYKNYSWRVTRPMDMTSKLVFDPGNLHLEKNSKVLVAWMLMNEASKPITDGHTNLVIFQSVIYSRGSNLTRINFGNFYTFVLEKGDKIIGAASIRFHGQRIAEMPFIAIDQAYKAEGILKLMTIIFLCQLKVENLVILCVAGTSTMWRHHFDFIELPEELKREVASYNILTFPHTLRMYKDLTLCRTGEPPSFSFSPVECPFSAVSRSLKGRGDDNKDSQLEDNQAKSQNGQEPKFGVGNMRPFDLNMDPPDEEDW